MCLATQKLSENSFVNTTCEGRVFTKPTSYFHKTSLALDRLLTGAKLFSFLLVLVIAGNSHSVAPLPQITIAYLDSNVEDVGLQAMKFLKAELTLSGWAEGRNVNYIARFAGHNLANLPALAAELVNEKPTIIVAPSQAAASAAQAATSSIPIVFSTSSDPVKEGLVPDLARPGGNITGFYQFLDLDAKLCQIAFDAFPNAQKIAFLYDQSEKNLPNVKGIRELETAFRKEVTFVAIRDVTHFRAVAKRFRGKGFDAIVVPMMYAFYKQPKLFIEELNLQRLPTVFERAAYVSRGGLLSYGPAADDSRKVVARMVARILAGASPATMPIERPQKLELTLNTETAQRLGIKLDRSFLVRVDRYFPLPKN